MTQEFRILVVEDHAESAEALCNFLRARFTGFPMEWAIAPTLAEGLAKAIDFRADITLLDLGLPGVTVMDVIRSIPFFPPPVIVLTDQDDPDSHIEKLCYEHSAQNFFSKNFLRDHLDTLDKEIQARQLVTAIVKAHWRHTLPRERAQQEHDAAEGV